jgi:hypothetical protein
MKADLRKREFSAFLPMFLDNERGYQMSIAMMTSIEFKG